MATFGNTDETGKTSTQNVQHLISGGRFTSPPDAGGATLDAVWVYLNRDNASGARAKKAAIYTDSDDTLFAESDLGPAITFDSPGWYEFTFTTPPALSASTAYILTCWSDGGPGEIDMYYNNADGVSFEESLTYTGTFPTNPAGGWDTDEGVRDYAIYVEYTPSGGSSIVPATSNIMNMMRD